MIPLINHDSQWGRGEVVKIYPYIYIYVCVWLRQTWDILWTTGLQYDHCSRPGRTPNHYSIWRQGTRHHVTLCQNDLAQGRKNGRGAEAVSANKKTWDMYGRVGNSIYVDMCHHHYHCHCHSHSHSHCQSISISIPISVPLDLSLSLFYIYILKLYIYYISLSLSPSRRPDWGRALGDPKHHGFQYTNGLSDDLGVHQFSETCQKSCPSNASICLEHFGMQQTWITRWSGLNRLSPWACCIRLFEAGVQQWGEVATPLT